MKKGETDGELSHDTDAPQMTSRGAQNTKSPESKAFSPKNDSPA